MDAETKQLIDELRKEINDLRKNQDKQLKVHREAVNNLAKEVRRQGKLLKTARENIRITKRELEGVRGSLRRL